MAALKGKALVAYLLVCMFWGSTYLAIRIGVAELPPFLFAGVRFLLAGVVLLVLAMALGGRLPSRWQDWRTLAVTGLFLLAGGNTIVVWAEQWVASGTASLFVVTVALWIAFFDAVLPGGESVLNWRVVLGLGVGFLGETLLVGSSLEDMLRADLRGPVALIFSTASWAFGSVYFRRHPAGVTPYVAAAVQMTIGGLTVTLLGLSLGEGTAWRFSSKGMLALGYLMVFGSIVGYTAYAYALRHASATIVGTYVYVNPVIAVLLGWLILGEPVTGRTFAAMALVLGAVLWIQFSHKLAAGRTAERTDGQLAGDPLPPANSPPVRQAAS